MTIASSKKKYIDFWLPAVLLAGVALCASRFLVDGCVFNGDFPLYIRQAQSVFSGNATQVAADMEQMIGWSTYPRYSPVLYPWGYPLLLAVPVQISGIDYGAFSWISTGCFLGGLYLFYRNWQLQAAPFWQIFSWFILIGFNTFYLYFCDTTSGELPFLFFAALSLYVLNRLYSSVRHLRKGWVYFITGILLFFTAQIRTEGYFLFASLLALQLRNGFRRTDWLPYAGGLFALGVFAYFFPSGYTAHFSHFQATTFESIKDNLIAFYQYPGILLDLPDTIFDAGFWLFAIWGFAVSVRKHMAEAVFAGLTLFLLIVWPYEEMRYWVTLFALLLFFFLCGIGRIPVALGYVRRGRWVVYALAGFCIGNVGWHTASTLIHWSGKYAPENPDITAVEATELFDFIRSVTLPGDVVACCESRAIYLYTGRLSCNLFGDLPVTLHRARWYVYFVHRDSYLQYPYSVIRENTEHFRVAFRNNDYIVYQLVE